jgi:hypothetical protein
MRRRTVRRTGTIQLPLELIEVHLKDIDLLSGEGHQKIRSV